MRSSSPRQMVCLELCPSPPYLTASMIAPNYPHSLHGLGQRIGHQNLPDLVQEYLFERVHPAPINRPQYPSTSIPLMLNTSKSSTPHVLSSVHHPTHPQVQGCTTKQFEQHPPGIEVKSLGHATTVFLFQMARAQISESNMSGLLVARALRFFSFVINGELHQCALIHWFSIFGDQPDPDNGMWVVTPDYFGSAVFLLSTLIAFSVLHTSPFLIPPLFLER